MSDPNLLNQANKALTGAGMTRSKIRKGHVSKDRVSHDTSFFFVESTAWDEQGNSIVSCEEAVHHVLACGCRVSSPSQIGGVCSRCAPGLLTRWIRRPRYVCSKCGVCIRCRKKLERCNESPGCLGVLLALLLYPFADVSWDE